MIYFKKQTIISIDDIFDRFKRNEFRSPYRSTIPLIVLFKSDQISSLGLINSNYDSEIKYTFEYKLPVLKGKGSPSCTDLMIEYDGGCIAIEAKRTEPPYETVYKWLSNSYNKKLVLDGWLEIINDYLGLKVELSKIIDLPYQLIHRVASACSLKKHQTQIVYIGFDLDEAKTKYYKDCLTAFSDILENRLDLFLVCYRIDKSAEQLILEKKWNLGERDLSEFIINGLVNDNLMRLTLIMKSKINKSA